MGAGGRLTASSSLGFARRRRGGLQQVEAYEVVTVATDARTGTETHAPSHSLLFAVWSGAIMLAAVLFGTLSHTAC